jgi:hypothetical protein
MVVDIHRPRQVTLGCYLLHDSQALETMTPGEQLAALLASIDPDGLDAYDLVSYLGACERQIAWTQAMQMAAMRALAGRRLVTGPHGEPADTLLPAGAVNDHAADEVAAVLSLARSTGQQRVWLATALSRPVPPTGHRSPVHIRAADPVQGPRDRRSPLRARRRGRRGGRGPGAGPRPRNKRWATSKELCGGRCWSPSPPKPKRRPSARRLSARCCSPPLMTACANSGHFCRHRTR